MYKISIIEDEPIMRKYLSNCLDWDKLNLELCGVYSKKETALKGILKNGTDIIITDIKLPDSDGLTLVSEVSEINPSIQFVVISAYSDFENVKKAFKIGALDYILKTEFEPEHLEQVLIKIVQRLDMAKNKEDSFERFTEKENVLKKVFWSNELKDIGKENLLWNVNDGVNFGSVGIIKLLNYKEILTKWDFEKEVMKYGVYNIAREIVTNAGGCEFFFNSYDEIVFLFSNASSGADILQNIVNILCSEFDFVIASGVCKMNSGSIMSNVYSKCVGIADYSFVLGRNKIMTEDIVKSETDEFDVIYYTDLFEEKIRNREFKKVVEILDELSGINPNVGDIKAVQDFFYSCMITLFRNSKEFEFDFIPYGDLHGYVQGSDVQGIISYMKYALMSFDESGFKQINDIENYIIKNYNKEINLKNIADEFCFEYSYFSRKFVKKTGKTFKQYLTDVRLENAYNLIMNTKHSMYEIAEMVGYKNYNSFSRNFTQKYGRNPTEMRKDT